MDVRLILSFVLSSLFVIAGSSPIEPSVKEEHQSGKDVLASASPFY